MPEFRYQHHLEVRYGDLDPQGHLNNAKYLTYMEQARINYIKHLGLWNGGSFLEIGIILANVFITYYKAIQFGDLVKVGVRVSRLGNKSLDMEYLISDVGELTQFASGSTVLVAFDYRINQTITIPNDWRTTISAFEGIPPFSDQNSPSSESGTYP